MRATRVLLADDLPEMLQKVSQLLPDDFEIVGTAENGQQAFESAAGLDPDLLVLDISMPILDGIEVASKLRERGCRARVIFVTVHEDRDFLDAAFSAGAAGYVLKSRIACDLIPALRKVMQGHRFISSFEGVDHV